MKIAILTQPLKHNYGGILQAYAMQRVLKMRGHEVVTINRLPDKRTWVRELVSKAIQTLKGQKVQEREVKTDFYFENTISFIRKNIILSESVSSSAELKIHFSKENYDAVIIGSDQTWRPKYSPNIYNYYLDFLRDSKIIKVAYATSFGVSEWEYNWFKTKKCAKLSRDFSAVSVRESSAVFLCNKKLNIDAVHVLDPTMLLDVSDYINLCENEDALSNYESNCFIYFLDTNKDKSRVANCVSRLLSVREENFFKDSYKENNDLHRLQLPSVEKWIWSFYLASFVVTDSFHGCVFSILFNKPFLVIENSERGNARLDSLLEIFGLRSRMISEHQSNEGIISAALQKIEWEIVNEKLRDKRAVSYGFINRFF